MAEGKIKTSREQTGMDEQGKRNSTKIRAFNLYFLVEGKIVAEQFC